MSDGSAILKQKLGQKLSSRQIQLMNMIMLPVTELEQRIKHELEENPALEEGREVDPNDNSDTDDASEISEEEMILGDYSDIDDVPDTELRHLERNATPGVEIPFSEEATLHEYLMDQISVTSLEGDDRVIAEFLIGSLDDDGYLRRDIEGLLDDLAIYRSIYAEPEDLQRVIRVIRTLDPPGIASSDLRQCLLTQLLRRPSSPAVDLAIRVLEDHFDLFISKNYAKLILLLGIDDHQLREAVNIITHLNPTPGLDFSTRLEDSLHTIIPDFYVHAREGELLVSLNKSDTPEVRVDKEFAERMQPLMNSGRGGSAQERETARFVRTKLDSARWFVEMIRQRNNTLMETMTAIARYQREYLLTGDMHHLKPMILKDIADVTGYDISTISRVTSTKYVQTDFGIFSLKHFFSPGTVTDDGEEITSRRVRQLLREIIDEEDKRKPYPDEMLVSKLKEKGLTVARRTVAKYRDMMNIPVARLRKEI